MKWRRSCMTYLSIMAWCLVDRMEMELARPRGRLKNRPPVFVPGGGGRQTDPPRQGMPWDGTRSRSSASTAGQRPQLRCSVRYIRSMPRSRVIFWRGEFDTHARVWRAARETNGRSRGPGPPVAHVSTPVGWSLQVARPTDVETVDRDPRTDRACREDRGAAATTAPPRPAPRSPPRVALLARLRRRCRPRGTSRGASPGTTSRRGRRGP